MIGTAFGKRCARSRLRILALVMSLLSLSGICQQGFAESSCYYPVSWEANGNRANGPCAPTESLTECLQHAADWWSHAYPSLPPATLDPSCDVGTFPNLGLFQCSALQGAQSWGDIGAVPAGCSTHYFVSATALNPSVCSRNCLGTDPINPAQGNVYTTEEDVRLGAGAITYRRFYNNLDATGVDGVPGWRHTYARSIKAVYLPPDIAYPGQSASISAEYSTQADACTQGFATIQSSVSAWAGATATFSNGSCVLSTAAGVVGTLQVQMTAFPLPTTPASPIEYDLIRDDGQTLRVTMQNGVVNNQPGTSLRLGITGSGFTVTDDQDTVETYDATGVLQSITSRTGVVQTLSYNGGLWSGVSDSFGNSLTVTRNAQGSIGSISVNGGGSVQYGYDSLQNLSTVTNLDNTTRSYLYGNVWRPTWLTSLVDENGTTYSTWTYGDYVHATSTSLALGANAVSLAYNSDGSVTATDALGAVRTVTFTRTGDQNSVTGITGSHCPGCVDGLATTYDLAGWVSSRADYNGNLTCYANDAIRGLEVVRVEGFASGNTCPSNLATYAPASGTRQRKISTTWNATFREPDTIAEANRTTSFTYNPSGNVHTKTVTDTTVTPNVVRTWTYTYDNFGRVLTADGPRTDVADVTTYQYYTCTTGAECGQVRTVTNAAGQVTTFNTYNAYGQPLTITDPNGIVTTLTYDARQRVRSRQVANETTAFDYWPTGLLKKVTLPDASYLLYTYDGAHRLTQISDALGNKIVYTLDAMGNRTAEKSYDPSNALHRTHTRVFNSLSQLYQDVNAAGTAAVTTTFGYDPQGNQTSVAAPLSRNAANAYDELNRLKQITDPASGVTQFGYDANDNLTAVTDPRTLTTSYSYNGFGDLSAQSSPDTGTTTNTYDSAGNLATSTDARGAVSTYSYDALNRVTQVGYSQGGTTDQTISFTYDTGTNGQGHLTGASDANHSIGWTYDALGRVTNKTQTVGTVMHSVGYGYASGDLTSLTTPSGQVVSYGYNGDHQVTSVAVNGTTVLNGATYEPLGPVSGWTWGNGTTTTRTYDTDGKISRIVSAGTKVYTYDNAFRITGITDTSAGSANWTYGYDALDRITSGTSPSITRGWTYDANGNRLTEGGTAPSSYSISPTSNQISSISGALARTYGYDAAGNTISYATVTATYNNAGRLQTVSQGGTTETAIYNALGQRIQKSGGTAATVLFWYDEAGHLLGEYDGTGALIEETVWLGDIPVATLRPNGASVSIYYVHSDQLNTPRQITRPSDNAQLWTWFSDPFGTDAANANPSGLGTFAYNLRFPGQVFDGQAGLHQNGYRDYDPATGRYAQSDPIGLDGGLNTYSYVGSDPLTYTDEWGLARCAYSIAQHSIICVSNDGQKAVISHHGIHSGLGPCRNNQSCGNTKMAGPVTPDTYHVAANTLPGHQGWWALQSTSWRPGTDGALCRLGLKRCGFNLHLGTFSEGCITFDKNDPVSVDTFNRISDLFTNDAPNNTLTVIPNIPGAPVQP
jgi:RHS repeat-associated protein